MFSLACALHMRVFSSFLVDGPIFQSDIFISTINCRLFHPNRYFKPTTKKMMIYYGIFVMVGTSWTSFDHGRRFYYCPIHTGTVINIIIRCSYQYSHLPSFLLQLDTLWPYVPFQRCNKSFVFSLIWIFLLVSSSSFIIFRKVSWFSTLEAFFSWRWLFSY